ncbi:TonB C-terminal domain-containing protein [Sphingosinicella sp. LHD-64]|uniref:TonB C-terminal domain-containing protein n=1 Tax=Sphingosinicella sp. LHD-64 TaxID=3072139 RepID=UPI00280D1020|nr:TonB C-terminal domain-containing protein [Sphingosinicella sp. LHD-64]MDQ8757547.1 TonB C-terminal domain-containing protein [Sphingosinicella sp. LHD-64]
MGPRGTSLSWWRLLPALASGLVAILVAPPAAGQDAPGIDERRYVIAAQPLAGALAEFATISGVDILYPQSLARGRRSTAIDGTYGAPLALGTILRGTGLSAHFTRPTAAVIYVSGAPVATSPPSPGASGSATLRLDMAEVRAPLMIGSRDRAARDRYARAVQVELRAILQSEGGYEGRSSRVEIAVAIDRRGRIQDVVLVRSSGEQAWDDHVRQVLGGRVLSQAPPVDLVEEMRFAVETDRLSDRGARSGRGPRW